MAEDTKKAEGSQSGAKVPASVSKKEKSGKDTAQKGSGSNKQAPSKTNTANKRAAKSVKTEKAPKAGESTASSDQKQEKDFAIVKKGKHQFYLEEGAKLDLPRINVEEGKEYVFEEVLAVSKAGEFKLGTPVVKGAKVKVFVIKHVKGPKKYGFKYKAKSRYRRKWGYRNLFTRIRVVSIEA